MNFLLIISEKPIPSVTSFTNDNNVTLKCIATGNPVPVVYWEKDNGDGQFVPLEGSGDKRHLGQNVIEVKLSEETYGTTYRCVANNTQGYNFDDYPLQGGHFVILSDKNTNRAYSYSRNWTGSSLQLWLMRGVFPNANDINLFF